MKKIIAEAISNTFHRRGTALPVEVPLALSDEFTSDVMRQKQWEAFVHRAAVANNAKKTLKETVEDIQPLLMKIIRTIH